MPEGRVESEAQVQRSPRAVPQVTAWERSRSHGLLEPTLTDLSQDFRLSFLKLACVGGSCGQERERQKLFKVGDTLLTQWPMADKLWFLNGNAWMDVLLNSLVRQASLDLFFPRKGTSLGREEISRCQAENIANQKPFLRWAKPRADALLARCLELETNPGRRRHAHVAGSQQGPKWLQKSLRPKTLDFFQDMGFLNPVSLKVTVHSVALTF